MELKNIVKINKPFRDVSEALNELKSAQEEIKAEEAALDSRYSASVQKQLVKMNLESLTQEELGILKLDIFSKIEDIVRELMTLYPTGHILTKEGSYFLNDDGASMQSGEVYISLRHDIPHTEDEGLNDSSFITTIAFKDGVYVGNEVDELLDTLESLSELLIAIYQE